MKGRRVYTKSGDCLPLLAEPGDYGKDEDGLWYCRPPVTGLSAGCLSAHQITEHEDGTITVTPSILITDGRGTWHGYLTHGVWSTC